MMNRTAFVVCVVAASLTAVVQAASAPAATGKSLEINACSLLTAAEISKVIGLPVSAGVRRDEGVQKDGSYSSACVWTISHGKEQAPDPTAPFDGKSFAILNAMQWPAGSGLASTFLQSFRDAAEKGVITANQVKRDFGDEALWWGDGLAVRKRDTSFGVSIFMPNAKPRRPAQFEEQLAPLILKRLDQRRTL